MNNLAILLCTYNSEKYLCALLDSLIDQTYNGWNLYIHDDLSNDSTLAIIDKYILKDKRIHLLDDTEKRGAKHGFMWLLEKVEADYYMFCDHDDVWLPTKIELSISIMSPQSDKTDIPLIVCTNAMLVDAQLNVINKSYWDYKCYIESMFADKYYHLFYNNVLGCTMLFNKKARDLALPYPAETAMHDSWLAVSTLWNHGRIIPVNKSLIMYRQHDGNTIGVPKVPSFLSQMTNCTLLMKKTAIQHQSSQPLTRMPFYVFFFLKLRYMIAEHLRLFIKKLKS